MGRYPTVDEEAGDELVIDLALGEVKKPTKKRERLSWRVLAQVTDGLSSTTARASAGLGRARRWRKTRAATLL